MRRGYKRKQQVNNQEVDDADTGGWDDPADCSWRFQSVMTRERLHKENRCQRVIKSLAEPTALTGPDRLTTLKGWRWTNGGREEKAGSGRRARSPQDEGYQVTLAPQPMILPCRRLFGCRYVEALLA